MLSIMQERIRQKHRTVAFPASEPTLPDRYRGIPCAERSSCDNSCSACIMSCPTTAISRRAEGGVAFDLGKCLFCGECVDVCPRGAIAMSREYRMSTRTREDLVVDSKTVTLAQELDRTALSLFGHSLKLRQVSAGGCNACEADLNVLGTIVFDLSRFGIQFVASPRHADGIVVTGPVTKNMELALRKTWEAMPSPRLVIAVGACAISGGACSGHDQARNGVGSVLPVDLYVPGCPPHPYTILDGLLRLLGRRGDRTPPAA